MATTASATTAKTWTEIADAECSFAVGAQFLYWEDTSAPSSTDNLVPQDAGSYVWSPHTSGNKLYIYTSTASSYQVTEE